MSLLESVAKPVAYLAYQQVLSLERGIGYKIKLNTDKSKWLGNGFPFDMSPVWKKFGLDTVGINYLAVGSLINNLSSRFDTSSPYYQVWLGDYTVKFTNSREWKLEDHSKLAIANQKGWLELYGEVSISGYSGTYSHNTRGLEFQSASF